MKTRICSAVSLLPKALCQISFCSNTFLLAIGRKAKMEDIMTAFHGMWINIKLFPSETFTKLCTRVHFSYVHMHVCEIFLLCVNQGFQIVKFIGSIYGGCLVVQTIIRKPSGNAGKKCYINCSGI